MIMTTTLVPEQSNQLTRGQTSQNNWRPRTAHTFECLYNMKAGFPLRGGCRRARQRLYPFDDFSSHKASHFCYILWLEGNQKKKKKRRESLSPTHIPGEGKRELSKNLQTYFKTTVILITFSRNMLKTIFLNLQHLSG